MVKALTAAVVLAGLGLAGCQSSSGLTYSLHSVQLDNGQHAYRVTCLGLLEDGATCRREAERICEKDGGQLHVLEGISPVGHTAQKDQRELLFQCGTPEQPAAAAPAAPVVAPVPKTQQLSLAGDATFDTAQATLRPAATQQLDKLIANSAGVTIDTVVIKGYTDSRGSTTQNLDLSQRRAQTVAHYLDAHGLRAHRYDVHGYGDAQPVASNATAQGRAQNRRVEILINQ
ncbi:OmpA family protein [Paraburkholderia antibiotica]|uniref:OmpA family protein n=1 Tax=Paraburkholderia antibiotica TaxID=2728839 RepID=A0A7Y0A0H0_9BURK|nr:OmpA family protein [Paraburkholderia antibiotica]NML34226.1 OmpA family protein [Paraburkholderia antibiotica]